MNTLELIDKREQLIKRAKDMLEVGKAESRKLSIEEENVYNSLSKEIADLNEEIRNAENTIINNNIKEVRTMGKFSLLKAINDIANNRQLDERAAAVVAEGIEEMRKAGQNYSGQLVLPVEERADIQATVALAGQEVVAEDKLNILEPLRARLVLTQAGATYMTGLVGDISIPVYDSTTVKWKGEVAAAEDGAGTFDEVNLQPKRLTAYMDISKQFLIQDSASAEEMLKADIVKAIADKLEATILGNGAGSTTEPAGIFNGAGAAALTYAGTVAMEEQLEAANVHGSYTYILSPSMKATLRTAQKDAGSGLFVYEHNEINGIPALCTSNAAGIVVGDFSDYVIAQWGSLKNCY